MSEFKRLHTGWSNAEKQAIIDNMKSQTLSTLIPAYSTSIEYSIGQYVVYSGALYRCIGTTTGAWDSTKWESATLEDLVDDVNGAVADVAHKASIDGYYSTMGVGHADSALSLDSNVGNDDQTPFNYQTAGGTSDIATGIQSLKKLVGASVVFNQLVQNGNFADISSWSLNSNTTYTVSNNVATIINTSGENNGIYQYKDIIANHKYLYIAQLKVDETPNSTDLGIYINFGSSGITKYLSSTNWETLSILVNASESRSKFIKISLQNWVNKNVYAKNVNLFDLTQMFGSQVADYIYAKEQANARDGVEIFKGMFPNNYYPYNTGTFIHSKSAKLKMVDYNQFNEVLENGKAYSLSNGAYQTNGSFISSPNKFKVLPNTEYYFKCPSSITANNSYVFYWNANGDYISGRNLYPNTTFTTPNNAYYMAFSISNSEYGTTYKNDISIFIYWDGSRIGYEPYQEHIYDLPNDELKGVLKVVDNKIVADGDEEYPSGEKKVRYGSYTFTGNEVYVYYSDAKRVIVTTSSTILGKVGTTNGISDTDLSFVANNYQYNGIYIATANVLTIFVCNIGVITDVQSAKDYLTGKTILYELATPTETTSTAFAEYIHADDFGTMEFLDENNARITGIQGNEIFYEANISAFAESLYVKTNGDVDEIVTKEDISDEALATRGYIKLASITGYDSTKTQVLKNIEGVFTWVDEV